MANHVYSAGSGLNDPMYGKFIHPIKALIENESNLQEKQKTILDILFNVEKSNRYAETIMGQSDFDTFQSVDEGGEPVHDNVQKTFDKTIDHIEFKKEFTITQKMADDAKFGMGANMKNAPKKFARAYYKTRVKLAAQALINGTKSGMKFNTTRDEDNVDLTTGDGLPLFSSAHTYFLDKMSGKTQSNYFCGEFTSSQVDFEKALNKLANQLRNFKSENGETLGYIADVLIIPCNRPELEMMAKKICGSERTTGSHNNDINTQYGNWTLVVLDGWETEEDRFMIMSSEANQNLYGNMFFNRRDLNIRYGVDDHTRNMYWNGYCRFGVGFGNWRHIALAVNGTVEGATAI